MAIIRDQSDRWLASSIIEEDEAGEPEARTCQMAMDMFIENGWGPVHRYFPYLVRAGENPVGKAIEDGQRLRETMEECSGVWSSGTVIGEYQEDPMFIEIAREEDILTRCDMPEYFREALDSRMDL